MSFDGAELHGTLRQFLSYLFEQCDRIALDGRNIEIIGFPRR